MISITIRWIILLHYCILSFQNSSYSFIREAIIVF